MSLIFDTSVLIDIENRDTATLEKLRELARNYGSTGQITFIALFEYLFGLHGKSIENKNLALEFINSFECIQTTRRTAEILSDLNYKYKKLGKMISLTDLMIAAQTIENNGILVTGDLGFNNIEELNKIIL